MALFKHNLKCSIFNLKASFLERGSDISKADLKAVVSQQNARHRVKPESVDRCWKFRKELTFDGGAWHNFIAFHISTNQMDGIPGLPIY